MSGLFEEEVIEQDVVELGGIYQKLESCRYSVDERPALRVERCVAKKCEPADRFDGRGSEVPKIKWGQMVPKIKWGRIGVARCLGNGHESKISTVPRHTP